MEEGERGRGRRGRGWKQMGRRARLNEAERKMERSGGRRDWGGGGRCGLDNARREREKKERETC